MNRSSISEDDASFPRTPAPIPIHVPSVSRLEVIDHTSTAGGRVVVRHDVRVSLSLQDGGTTLKVFLDDRPDENPEARMTLHEAMREVLRSAPGRRMSPRDLCEQINRRGLYRMRDGRPVEVQQIHARCGNYPQLFRRVAGDIELVGG